MSTKKSEADSSQQQFRIVKMYTKDVSFESPRGTDLFAGSPQTLSPNVNMQINSAAHKVGDDLFDLTLTLSVNAKIEDANLYLVEVKQAGLFVVKNFDDATREALLGTQALSALFPFARQLVASLVANGGFPQLLLDPINFDAIYSKHLAERQNAPAPTTSQ